MVYHCCFIDYLAHPEHTVGLMDPNIEEELRLIKDLLSELTEQVDGLKVAVSMLYSQYKALGRSFGGEDASIDEGFGPGSDDGSYL